MSSALGPGRAALALVLLAASACAGGKQASTEARRAVVEANMWELQDCWAELADDHPGASGSLLFAVEIRRNGSVEWVDIEVDELAIPKLSACTVRRIKKWKFPEDRGRRSLEFGVGFAGAGSGSPS